MKRCDGCALEFSCFDGSKPCAKRPTEPPHTSHEFGRDCQRCISDSAAPTEPRADLMRVAGDAWEAGFRSGIDFHDKETQSKEEYLAAIVAEVTRLKAAAPPESPTSPFVLAFAKRMEAKLAMNRHKGDREGWFKDSPTALLGRLRQETRELEQAMGEIGDGECVADEAADVANFAMMIADIAVDFAALAPRPKRGGR